MDLYKAFGIYKKKNEEALPRFKLTDEDITAEQWDEMANDPEFNKKVRDITREVNRNFNARLKDFRPIDEEDDA